MTVVPRTIPDTRATEKATPLPMADLPPSPDATDETDDDTGTPRWVYVFGLILIALLLVVVILHLAGGGLGGHTS